MQKKFQQVEIGLASPKQIKEWAERELPNGEIIGEVTSWETVNYKTLKPEPNGLFCQRIFGPVVDYICACGKKSNKVYMGYCLKCGVEITTSRVRRYRLGYIKLKQPLVHTLYASHKPSPLSLCLNWSNKRIQAIMYATEFCKLPSQFTNFVSRLLIDAILFKKLKNKISISKKNLKRDFLQSQNKHLTSKNSYFLYKSNLAKSVSFLQSQKSVFNSQIKKDQPELSYEKFVFGSLLRSKRETEYNKIISKHKKPKLFRSDSFSSVASLRKTKLKKLTQKYIKTTQIETDSLLYGVSYDATWRQVENLQSFLLYISEQAKSYEKCISYYDFKKTVHYDFKKIGKNNTTTEIPFHEQFYPIQTGGFVFQQILSHFELLPLLQQFRLQHHIVKNYILYLQDKLKSWYPSEDSSEFAEKQRIKIGKKLTRLKQYQKKDVKRVHYFRDFYNTNMNPAWMILSYLPVLPPGLRPIMSIQGELIVSDINSLYRKVLTRNKRVNSVTKFQIFDTALSGSWASWCYNLRQVQESVDSLFKTGSVDSGKTTKSLLESLKGKKGRFRQHLLGKRVDYSGRSVIVVGPNLKIYECGLPKQMAIELFQPFLIQKLRNKRIALTTTAAKTIITQKKPIVWSLLAEIMKNHPVLLNRAPTLHRLGIQAFLPRLVEGKAILLHPLVCPAFNADFDGDQMAVHIPLGTASRSEAFHLMWSRNHILAPASAQPLLLPTQDMVLGCYYLTIFKDTKLKNYKNNIVTTKNFSSGYYFSTLNQVEQAYEQGIIDTHTSIWVRWFGIIQNFITEQESKKLEQPIEFRIDCFGKSEYIFHDRQIEKGKLFVPIQKSEAFLDQNEVLERKEKFSKVTQFQNYAYIRTTPGRILFHNKFPL